MATNAVSDTETLPWSRENTLGRQPAEELVVMVKGFIDSTVVDVPVQLNKRRFISRRVGFADLWEKENRPQNVK